MVLWVCRVLGGLCVALVVICAYTPVPNHVYDWMAVSSQRVPAQAIVVLGSDVSRDGVLDEGSLRRALRGILLQKQGLAPVILFLGYARPDGPKEAQVRAAFARDLGVPEEAILVETRARTTREEAALAWARLQPRAAARILLVTDPQHLVRAQRLFAQVGFSVIPAASEDFLRTDTSPEGRLTLARQVLQELLARGYYRLAGYL